ncbi:MAG: DUF488 family protein [Acidobacteriota bacterium]
MKLFTIGFTKKSAERFFTTLKEAGVSRVLDIRLHNVSQLAGFAKRDDLRYFLKAICGIDYVAVPELAPTEEIFAAYRKGGKDWAVYEKRYLNLITERKVEKLLKKELFDGGCLLCSEETPDRCHRRLAAEYLLRHWGGIEIVHLL